MNISIKLMDSDTTIRRKILESISEHVDKALSKSLIDIKIHIQRIMRDSILNQPEYQSLMSGQLRYEFGIEFDYIVDAIVREVKNTVRVSKRNTTFNRSGVSGGLIVEILNDEDIINLTQLRRAFVEDNKRNYALPWLRWLLLEGTNPIIKNYEVKIGPNRFSRTGMAIMIDSDASWSVPNNFAGTISNNWLTRAIDAMNETEIAKFIQLELEKNL